MRNTLNVMQQKFTPCTIAGNVVYVWPSCWRQNHVMCCIFVL